MYSYNSVNADEKFTEIKIGMECDCARTQLRELI